MKNLKEANLWVVRPKPSNQDRTKEFKEENIIAIGWKFIGDMKKLDNSEIRKHLKKHQPDKSTRSISLQFGMLKRFKEEIKRGDIVIVPETERPYVIVGKVNSEYEYKSEKKEDGYPHQRKVEWIKEDIRKEEIPEVLKDALRPRLTLYSLDKYEQEIKKWLEGGKESEVKLRDAIYIHIMVRESLPSHTIEKVFRIAEAGLPKRLQEKAKSIYDKSLGLFERGYWLGSEDGEKTNLWESSVFGEDSWVDELLDLHEKGLLEETSTKQFLKSQMENLSKEEIDKILQEEENPVEKIIDRAFEKKREMRNKDA